MRTRTLLLLALACGVAILVAGTFLLVGLAGQEEEQPADVGRPVEIGDLTVVVVGSSEQGGRVDVTVELGGVDDPDAAAAFRLVVPRGALAPVDGADAADADAPPGCSGSTVEPRRCVLTFELPDDPGSARVLFYRRGDEQVRWELPSA